MVSAIVCVLFASLGVRFNVLVYLHTCESVMCVCVRACAVCFVCLRVLIYLCLCLLCRLCWCMCLRVRVLAYGSVLALCGSLFASVLSMTVSCMQLEHVCAYRCACVHTALLFLCLLVCWAGWFAVGQHGLVILQHGICDATGTTLRCLGDKARKRCLQPGPPPRAPWRRTSTAITKNAGPKVYRPGSPCVEACANPLQGGPADS